MSDRLSPLRGALPLAIAASLALSGCENLQKLRVYFRGEPGAARLRLDVAPSVGLTIAIDGKVVGTAAPFEGEDLPPGAHKLSIAAPDHFTFTVPIEIQSGTPLKLRIALRRVPPEPPVRLKATQPRDPKPQAPETPKQLPLPAGVTPVTITIAGEPSTNALLDGDVVPSKILKIDHVTGDLGMGRLRVGYRVGAGGMLELRVPDDGTQWFRDGEPVDPDARLSFYRGKTRLQQIQPNGETQTVFLAR
ncbi:MAG: PEGA domain-containing protein [Myxococcota bacterium]